MSGHNIFGKSVFKGKYSCGYENSGIITYVYKDTDDVIMRVRLNPIPNKISIKEKFKKLIRIITNE